MRRTSHKRRVRILLRACLKGLLCLLVVAPARAEVTGEVLEYGYYQAITAPQRIRNDELPSGYERAGGEVRLVQQTDRIPLAKDRLFGFRFRIKGFSKDQVVAQLRLEVTHPEMTSPDGSKSTGYKYPLTLTVRNGQIEDKTGYQLNRDFELVEGDWHFAYWMGERKLLEKTFTVVKPDLMPASQPATLQEAAGTPTPQQAEPPAEKPQGVQLVSKPETDVSESVATTAGQAMESSVSPATYGPTPSGSKAASLPQTETVKSFADTADRSRTPSEANATAVSQVSDKQSTSNVRLEQEAKTGERVIEVKLAPSSPDASMNNKSKTDQLSNKLPSNFKQQINAIIKQYQAKKTVPNMPQDANNGPLAETHTAAETQSTQSTPTEASTSRPSEVAQETVIEAKP